MRDTIRRFLSALAAALALTHGGSLLATPVMPAGDSVLRHDIQVLADHGIIDGPVLGWPLAWAPILAAVRDVDNDASRAPALTTALARVRARAEREMRTRELMFSAAVGAADDPLRIRSFESTPRESAEIGAALSWAGDRLSVTLQAQAVDQAQGGGEVRADGSMVGVTLGNWLLSANTLDRWWGPGWDGNIILSNNARPIPAVSLDRTLTDAFESRWLRWIGPWDLSVMMGQLEGDREIPDALFFGMRFQFRPLTTLEIGLSRTAQWCGDGRPCDAGTFSDLLLGLDNRGDAGIEIDNEPGNQLAGVDFRWSQRAFGLPTAVYGQFIGEDEAGGFPSRYLGQVGVEASGTWREHWSWRWFGEFAGTSCQFHESTKLFNCGYNHGIYQTGYRYRGRPIGHGADNDAELVSTGLFLVDSMANEWRAVARVGELNRGGTPDVRNTLSPDPQDLFSIDVSHSRPFRYGNIEVGLGYEETDGVVGGRSSDSRIYLQWNSAY